MRTAAAGLLLLGSLVSPVGAEPAAGPSPRKVSIALNQTPLRQALASLFGQTGARWTIDRQVPDVPVTLTLREAEPDTALRLVVRLAGRQVPRLASEDRETGVRIYIRPAEAYVRPQATAPRPAASGAAPDAPPEAAAVPKFTADLQQAPLRRVLTWLMPSQPSPLAIAEDVPDVPVTLSLKDADPDSAVQLVLRQAALAEPALQWRKENGRLSVSLRKEGEGTPEEPPGSPEGADPAEMGPEAGPGEPPFPGFGAGGPFGPAPYPGGAFGPYSAGVGGPAGARMGPPFIGGMRAPTGRASLPKPVKWPYNPWVGAYTAFLRDSRVQPNLGTSWPNARQRGTQRGGARRGGPAPPGRSRPNDPPPDPQGGNGGGYGYKPR